MDSVSSVAKVLAEFDSLIGKGDYEGARTRMESAARRGRNAPGVETLRAASRVAGALAARRKAIARAFAPAEVSALASLK